MSARFEEEMRKELKEFKSKIERELRKELREVKESLEFLSKQFDESKINNETLQKENEALKKENLALKEDCDKCMKQLNDHETRITNSEQYSRNRNVEIKGIEEGSNENLHEILCQMGTTLNEPITASDIDVCHRVKTKNDASCSNIVVQFKSRSKRDAFLLKARKTRLSTSDIGRSTDKPVFVNEHLCPNLKRLLGMAISKKKACEWKFVWTRDGKIFARKDEQSKVVRVHCESDIAKII